MKLILIMGLTEVLFKDNGEIFCKKAHNTYNFDLLNFISTDKSKKIHNFLYKAQHEIYLTFN